MSKIEAYKTAARKLATAQGHALAPFHWHAGAWYATCRLCRREFAVSGDRASGYRAATGLDVPCAGAAVVIRRQGDTVDRVTR